MCDRKPCQDHFILWYIKIHWSVLNFEWICTQAWFWNTFLGTLKNMFFQVLTHFNVLYFKNIFINITTKLIQKDFEALEALKLTVLHVSLSSDLCLKARILSLAKQFLSVFLQLTGSVHSFSRKCLPDI